MAVEIMDGCTGEKHISSEDLAVFNQALYGRSEAVLPWGNRFACTMSTANRATVGTGAGMVGGKRFWAKTPTEVTVSSGTQAQRRNDVIVARYASTSEGIESVSLAVVRGTPSSGAPSDPALQPGDLALWRIPLNGVAVGTPQRMFEEAGTLAGAVGTVLFDRAWTNDGFASATLSERGADYTYLEIYYHDNDGNCASTKVYAADGARYSLTTAWADNGGGGNMWIKTRVVKLSGKTLATYNDGSWNRTGDAQVYGGSAHVEYTAHITIDRVVGIR